MIGMKWTEVDSLPLDHRYPLRPAGTENWDGERNRYRRLIVTRPCSAMKRNV
jgi:hypothetical protein